MKIYILSLFICCCLALNGQDIVYPQTQIIPQYELTCFDPAPNGQCIDGWMMHSISDDYGVTITPKKYVSTIPITNDYLVMDFTLEPLNKTEQPDTPSMTLFTYKLYQHIFAQLTQMIDDINLEIQIDQMLDELDDIFDIIDQEMCPL